MSERSRIIRKFERFLSGQNGYYNNVTEIRPDTGAVLDEKERAEELRRYRKKSNYDFNSWLESPFAGFSYVGKKTGKDRFYLFRSRGKKQESNPSII